MKVFRKFRIEPFVRTFNVYYWFGIGIGYSVKLDYEYYVALSINLWKYAIGVSVTWDKHH